MLEFSAMKRATYAVGKEGRKEGFKNLIIDS